MRRNATHRSPIAEVIRTYSAAVHDISRDGKSRTSQDELEEWPGRAPEALVNLFVSVRGAAAAHADVHKFAAPDLRNTGTRSLPNGLATLSHTHERPAGNSNSVGGWHAPQLREQQSPKEYANKCNINYATWLVKHSGVNLVPPPMVAQVSPKLRQT